MLRLFTLTIEILDDQTFSKEEMVKNAKEALEIHLEAIKVHIKCSKAEDVIATLEITAEA